MKTVSKSILSAILFGLCAFANAGILTEQIDTSSTTSVSTTGTNPGIVVMTNGATECTGTALGTIPISASTSTSTANTGSSVSYYQVYWQQTSVGEVPPTTLYAHEFVTDYGGAQATVTGSGTCVMTLSAGVSGGNMPSGANVNAHSATTGAPVSINILRGNALKYVVSYSGLTWTQIGTTPGGFKIYKNTTLLKVTTPTVTASASAGAMAGITGSHASVTAGFAISIYILTTS